MGKIIKKIKIFLFIFCKSILLVTVIFHSGKCAIAFAWEKNGHFSETMTPHTSVDVMKMMYKTLLKSLGEPHVIFYDHGKKYYAWCFVFTNGKFFLFFGNRGMQIMKEAELIAASQKVDTAVYYNYPPYKNNNFKDIKHKLFGMLHSSLGDPQWQWGSGIGYEYWLLADNTILMANTVMQFQIEPLPAQYKNVDQSDQIIFIKNMFKKPLYLFK